MPKNKLKYSKFLLLFGVMLTIAPTDTLVPSAENPKEGVAAVMTWSRDRVKNAEASFQSFAKITKNKRLASPNTWAKEIVYQIVVDRFNDGDPTNNQNNIENFQSEHQSNDLEGINNYHHGGDLKGITERLGYLSKLGVTSLWITPILKSSSSYHGYCTQNFAELDPAFGTKNDLRQLVTAAHQLGIKVILDIVVNHICDNNTDYNDHATPFNSAFFNLCVSDLGQEEWNNPTGLVRGQRELEFGPTFFKPLRNQTFYNRCGHLDGTSKAFGPPAIFGDFSSSMFDFNTLNGDFQAIFIELHKYWIAYADVDGFRLDAAKHVTPDFVGKFSTEIRSYAESIGKKNFFIIGEIVGRTDYVALYLGDMYSENGGGRPLTVSEMLPKIEKTAWSHAYFPHPGLNAIYDFGHSHRMRSVFQEEQGLSPLNIKNWFWKGDEVTNDNVSDPFLTLVKSGSDTATNWNLIEIHDWPRFLTITHDEWKFRAALGYLFTTHGVPIIYYGMEQGLDGMCNFNQTEVKDPRVRNQLEGVCRDTSYDNHTRYRQDMFITGPWRLGSIVRSSNLAYDVNHLAHIGYQPGVKAPAVNNDPYLNTKHDLYNYMRKLIAIRKSCSALSGSVPYFRVANKESGLLAFSRVSGSSEALVVLNSSGKTFDITDLKITPEVNGANFNKSYVNLLNAKERGTVVHGWDESPHLSFKGYQVLPHSVAIFVLEDNMQPFNKDLDTYLCI